MMRSGHETDKYSITEGEPLNDATHLYAGTSVLFGTFVAPEEVCLVAPLAKIQILSDALSG